MSNDTPKIVADNHVVQVMNASQEYLGHNPESVLHILGNQDSLRKGYGKTLENVLLTLPKCNLFPINLSLSL